MNYWGLLAHLLLIFGTGLLGFLAIRRELLSIAYFQRHLNEIEEEEREKRFDGVHPLNVFKRQRIAKQITEELKKALTEDEVIQSRETDYQFYGWLMLFASSIIFAVQFLQTL